MKMPRVIAEIGCNHKGDIEVAREMIGIAATFAKCDFVKFQKRSNKELLTPEEYNAVHPNLQNSYGESYGAHREFLEFDVDQHRHLQKWCRDFGVGYSTSVWDLTSAKEIAGLNPEFIKIPSACNLNFPMLQYLARNYEGDIHISMGMTTPSEQEQIVQLMEECNAANRVVLYACTSGYPVPFEQVYLREIQSLSERFGSRIKEIRFSGITLVSPSTLPRLRWVHPGLNATSRLTEHGKEPTMPPRSSQMDSGDLFEMLAQYPKHYVQGFPHSGN